MASTTKYRLLSIIKYFLIVFLSLRLTLDIISGKTKAEHNRKYNADLSWRLWNFAEGHTFTWDTICYSSLTTDQLKMISARIGIKYPQCDTVYVTIIPKRVKNQVYSVTDNPPTVILMRLWGKSDGIFVHMFDPSGDSLKYLNPIH